MLAAVQRGDESAFVTLAERYRRQLHVHCYRMLGSFEDAEDVVQETLLRAWRNRSAFEGRSLFRTWLYRIATNACLDALARRPRRITAPDVGPANEVDPRTLDPNVIPTGRPELPWLEPYPDSLLEPAAPSEQEPDAVVVSRETIELAYLAAIQHLPPRQRAVLLLRDSLGWSAKEVAAILEMSVPSVNSALQRARSTMRDRMPERRLDWTASTGPTEEERAVLERFMLVHETHDVAGMIALLREDARQTMPPIPMWWEGQEAMVTVITGYLSPGAIGDFRMVPTGANRQPAAACYLRRPGESRYTLIGLDVLRVEGGRIVEVTGFGTSMLKPFGLPPTL